MSDINTPADQGGLRKRSVRQSVQVDYGMKMIDRGSLSSLKRMVDKGSADFWRRRGMKEPANDFRELVRSGAREGMKNKGQNEAI